MTNAFYTATGVPTAGSQGSSAVMRSEFALIQAAFDLVSVPTIPASPSRALVVAADGLSFTTTVGQFAIAGNLTTTGAFNTTLVQQATVSLTLPATTGTLALTSQIPSAAVGSEVRTGTDTAKYLTVDSIYDASASVSITYGATVTLDFSTFLNCHITLTGNVILANPTTGIIPGKSGVIRITQD